MTTEIFTIYDKVACQCTGIIHAVNRADAVRLFKRKFKDADDREDFRLLKLGQFDHDKGIIEALDLPEDVETGPSKADKEIER